MAVKTKAAILAEIATLLASNIQIPASDLRTVLNDIVDSYPDGSSYQSLIFNFTQVGTSTPEFKDINGDNNPFINTTGATLTWARVSAGVYAVESNISLFDKATFWMGTFHQMQGGTNTWSIPLYGAGGINGFIYANIENSTTLKIRSANSSAVLTELSTLLGSTDPISFPEIKIFV